MKLLLDTHIWLWSQLEPEKLTQPVARALASTENELWLSPVSTWEVLLLAGKGRVELHPQASEWISRALTQLHLKEASLTHEIALETRNVRLPHRDPVDIFLVATARVLGLTLVTADRRLLAANGLSTLANR